MDNKQSVKETDEEYTRRLGGRRDAEDSAFGHGQDGDCFLYRLLHIIKKTVLSVGEKG